MDALSERSLPPILGALKRSEKLYHPSRHLGLVQASEREDLNIWLNEVANEIENNIDLGKLEFCNSLLSRSQKFNLKPPGKIIAIAKDKAFSFIYPHMEQDWKLAGSKIIYFSPLADEPAPKSDFIYLPGGYPELYAGQLAKNKKFLDSVRNASKEISVYGECGGYMVLGEILVDKAGKSHKMLNLLDLVTSIEKPKLTLGYRKLKSNSAPMNGTFTGHEFHYARTLKANGKRLFTTRDASDNSLPKLGLVKGRVSGSFAHIIDRH
jgi:cobyrinic acid a,c-diamide synthase